MDNMNRLNDLKDVAFGLFVALACVALILSTVYNLIAMGAH